MSVEVLAPVAAAIADGHPVVALESTIISHGMPFPSNIEMAEEVESIVRANGAEPATIAVIAGRCHVGLTPDQLRLLATSRDVHKATTRDLPWLLARRAHGATTVAATMRLAAAAGIRVFATGGLGGVHRGAATSFDISADLTELAATPVAVVSSGVKSILDIGATLQRLETLGVPVLVNGSDEFPAFYSRSSGHPAPRRVDGADEVAAVLRAAWHQLGLRCGVCVANPIAAADEIPADEIASAVAAATRELDERGVVGQDVTPFLLSWVVEATAGRSLTANRALVRGNAAFAAQVAASLARGGAG